jgi:hypothetical protein
VPPSLQPLHLGDSSCSIKLHPTCNYASHTGTVARTVRDHCVLLDDSSLVPQALGIVGSGDGVATAVLVMQRSLNYVILNFFLINSLRIGHSLFSLFSSDSMYGSNRPFHTHESTSGISPINIIQFITFLHLLSTSLFQPFYIYSLNLLLHFSYWSYFCYQWEK